RAKVERHVVIDHKTRADVAVHYQRWIDAKQAGDLEAVLEFYHSILRFFFLGFEPEHGGEVFANHIGAAVAGIKFHPREAFARSDGRNYREGQPLALANEPDLDLFAVP